MVVDPSGKFAYVVVGAAGVNYGIAMYSIDATSGALTSIGTVAVGSDFTDSIGVDPAGKFFYVTIHNHTP
jgi:6-phosphogluconolactonase (cycloisomerase 2 family)